MAITENWAMKRLNNTLVLSGYVFVTGLYLGVGALLIWLIVVTCDLKDRFRPSAATRSNTSGASGEIIGETALSQK